MDSHNYSTQSTTPDVLKVFSAFLGFFLQDKKVAQFFFSLLFHMKKHPSSRKNLSSKGKNIWIFSLLRKKSKVFSLGPKEKIFDFFRCYEKYQKFFPLDQRKKLLIFFVATKKVKKFFLWLKGKIFWFFS